MDFADFFYKWYLWYIDKENVLFRTRILTVAMETRDKTGRKMHFLLIFALILKSTQCGFTNNHSVEERFANQEKRIQTLEAELRELKAISTRRHDRRDLPSQLVAFSARTNSQLNGLGDNQIITFSHVVENIGSGYNSHDGIFTVPVDGTYVFTWTIVTTDGRVLYTKLQKNGAVYGYSRADSEDGDDASASTNIIILRAQKGDHVSIQRDGGDHTVDGQYKSSTFSGWLIGN